MEKDDKGSTLIRIGVRGESSFWYRPTRVVPDQRPLNGRCCCCCTRVSQYQKGETKLDFTAARDSEWQWNQLGHIQLCMSLKTDNHALVFYSAAPKQIQVKSVRISHYMYYCKIYLEPLVFLDAIGNVVDAWSVIAQVLHTFL